MTGMQTADYSPEVSSKEYEKLMKDLAEWCSVQHGRQAELAKRLGVTKQTVNHWLLRRRKISFDQAVAIRKIIRRQREKPEAE